MSGANPWGSLLLVGSGGFVGSALRWLVAGWVQRGVAGAAFPWGTLAVNVTGCFLIGIGAGVADWRGALGPELRLFLLIGVLGGFTTFSTFGYETVALLRDGEGLRAAASVVAHLAGGLLAVVFGYALGGR